MSTPYGTSNFAYGDVSSVQRWLTLSDPMGFQERVEFDPQNLSIPYSFLPQGMFTSEYDYVYRNTFYWNKHVVATVGTSDPNKSHIMHWVHDMGLSNSSNTVATTLESEKLPLENRVWYDYPGQYYGYGPIVAGDYGQPDHIGRLLDDGSTQLQQYTYNIIPSIVDAYPPAYGNGNLTSETDPAGRQTRYTYDPSNIDLVRVEQQTSPGVFSTLATMAYDSQHNPLTRSDAAGQVWQYSYNAAGQITTATNPLGQTQAWVYDALGRLSQISVPGSTAVAASYNYGGACAGLSASANTNLPYSVTDSEGYTLCYQYDALDRVTTVKYPDGTTDQYSYTFPNTWPVVAARGTPSLDLWKMTDRLGRVTTYGYDQNRRMTSVTEPATVNGTATTRTTQYTYYNDGALKDQVDANGNVTHFNRDIQSRVTSKIYAYGTANAKTETYTYDSAGRLKTVTDAKGQVQTLTYNVDDTTAGINYANAAVPTPGVSFSYDPYFLRRTGMMDQFGLTSWTYKPLGTLGALQLDTEDAHFANDAMTYSYDPVGRISSLTIPPTGAETFTYDPLGRLSTHGTALGTFNYNYLGNSGQVTNRTVTNGTKTLATTMAYGTNANDRRLASISHSGAARSYGFTTNGLSTINRWV